MPRVFAGRLYNTTPLPPHRLREIIGFVTPSGVSGFRVTVRNRSHASFNGTAAIQGSEWWVTLSFGKYAVYPKGPERNPRGGAYLPLPWFASVEEAVVFLAAHELRHLWQARVPRGRRVWGAKGQYSERDADAYAIRKLRAWRRTTAPTPRAVITPSTPDSNV